MTESKPKRSLASTLHGFPGDSVRVKTMANQASERARYQPVPLQRRLTFFRSRETDRQAPTADSSSRSAQPETSSNKQRQSPAEQAARLFAPEDIPTPPVVVRGPLISTPTADSPSPRRSAARPAVEDEAQTPKQSTLPPASPPPEVVPPGGEFQTAAVEIVLDQSERDAAERWNQERIERKLRGEYERAGKHLAEIVSRAGFHVERAHPHEPSRPLTARRSTTTSTLLYD